MNCQSFNVFYWNHSNKKWKNLRDRITDMERDE